MANISHLNKKRQYFNILFPILEKLSKYARFLLLLQLNLRYLHKPTDFQCYPICYLKNTSVNIVFYHQSEKTCIFQTFLYNFQTRNQTMDVCSSYCWCQYDQIGVLMLFADEHAASFRSGR